MSRHKSRGGQYRHNVQQGDSSASSTTPAVEENSQSSISQNEDSASFEDAVDTAFGADLESVFSDGELVLEDAPTLDDMGYTVESGVARLHGRGQQDQLPTPKPRPGFEQRLAAYLDRGKSNPDRIAKTRMNGYVPRRVTTLTDEERRIFRCERFGNDGIVRIGRNYVLVERRKEVGDAKRAIVRDDTQRRIQAVDHDYRAATIPGFLETDNPGDFVSREERVGGGRRPFVAPNRNV